MSKEPESLEETQRRLAGYGSPASGSIDDNPTIPVATPTAPGRSRSPLVVVALATILAVGGVGASVALFAGGGGSPDWTAYPGSSYRTVDEVLAGDSLETVKANGDAFVAEYMQELTDTFGVTWTQRTAPFLGSDINGYGGDSMLTFYTGGEWQGSVTLDDPTARQRISDIFERLAYEHLAIDVYAKNDITSVGKEEQYGAADKADQAAWELVGSGSDTHNIRFRSVVYDRTLPTDPTFEGAPFILIEEGDSNTLFVYVVVNSYALLAEADRDAFIEALEPYDGLTPPEP